MPAYLLRRLLHALAIVAFATIASFVLLQLAPGNPLQAELEQPGRTAKQRSVLRKRYGLERSLPAQVIRYVEHVTLGDLGVSISEQRPVTAVLADALPATLLLSGTALALSVLVGVGTGTVQGWRPRDRLSAAVGTMLMTFYALPDVVVAVAVLSILGLHLRLFPVGGVSDPMVALTGDLGARLLDRAWHVALPAMTLALSWGAAIARQQRVAIREVASEYFVRTARAKGVRPYAVWARHALRPSLPGTVALIGTMVPVLVGGTVVVESLFSWSGMGALLVRAVSQRDYPLVAGAVILISLVTAGGTLVTDIAVAALDPRVRAGIR